MKRGLYKGIFVMSASMLLIGCGVNTGNSFTEETDKAVSVQINGEQTVAEGAETTQREETAHMEPEITEPETTEPETGSPFEQYPFGIEGLEIYDEKDQPGHQAGEAYLMARLANDAKVEEGYFSLDNLFVMSDLKAIICYSVSDKARNLFVGDAEGVYDAEIKYTQYLVSYDLKNNTVMGKIALHNEEVDTFVEQVGNCIWYWEQDGEMLYGTCYDLNLQEKAVMTKTLDEGVYVCENGYSYCVRDNCIWEKSLSDRNVSEEQKIVLSQDYAVYYLDGIYTDAEGTPYGVVGGMAADLQMYAGVVDLSTGEFVYLQKQDYMMVYVNNGSLIAREVQNENEENTVYYIAPSGQPLCSYRWNGQENMNMAVLSDGKILFYYFSFEETGTKLHVELYDSAKKELLGSSTFDVQSGDVWLCDNPFMLEDGVMLLPVTDMSVDTYFYRWEYGTSGQGLSQVTAKAVDVPADAVAQIEYKWNPVVFVPQECPEEFAALREKADALEEQFGVDIYISDECSNIFGNYAIVSLSDYEAIDESLDILEYELGKYPEGFFEQFKGGWIEGIDIYLAGQLMGINGDSLEYAAGFETDYNGSYAVVIDSAFPDNVRSTIHHELSHAIDSQMMLLSDDQQMYLDEAYWALLNPSADVYGTSYTYTYAQFGRPEMMSYTYLYAVPEEAYFIDDYSMTFPTEDRARLFENIMSDAGWVDWENAPHLREKLNYYASCIRSAFDTTGWNRIPWEMYMEFK